MYEVIDLKKILSLILAQLLVISMIPLFSFNVFAEWAAPTLGLSTLFNLSSNTVTATVTISNYDGLGALNFTLGYEASKVSYASHTAYSFINTGSATINNIPSPGYVSAVWSTDDLAAGDSGTAATILVVTFSVVLDQSGTAAFSLTDCSFSDNNGENETSGSTVASSVILPEAVTGINVIFPVPVKDDTPVSTVSGTGWTGTVEWTPAIFNKFVGGTVYTADVTLIPAVNYKFSSPAVTLNGDAITPAASSAAEITFSKTFPATADEDLAISDQTLGGSLKVGDVYTATINTTGGTGAKIFTITAGTLPAGLGLTPATGNISGTPTVYNASPTNITIRVTDVNTLGVTAVITVPAVAKDDSTFTAPTGLTATYGDILSSVILPAGYTWIDGSLTVGNAGTNSFPAKYNSDPAAYEDSLGNIPVVVNKKVLTTTGTPAVTGTLIYGQKLSNLNITVIMKDGTTTVPGTIVWDNPNFIPNVGAAVQTWTFTPTDNNTYSIKKGNSAITVNKATPTITLLNKSSLYTGSFIEINTAVVVLANNEIYNGVITYNYYTDLACTILTAAASGALNTGAAPIKAGTYYCKASIAAIGNYNSASSNIATLIINAPAYYTISNTAGTGGKITPKQTNVAPGSNVTVTITPDYGYKIAFVKIDGVTVDTKSIYKLENISQDHTVAVTFIKTAVTDEEPFAFTDVTPDAWYYDSILFVYNKGLMKGVSSELFDPQGTMTRAMLVTVLWRMDGSPAASLGNNPFSDVASGQWYTNAVLWAYGNNIVYGYDSDTFGPGDYINREQLMTIIYRYLYFTGYDMTATNNLKTFSDAGDISDWALDAMKFAVGEKLITGVTPTTLEPKGNATRAQVATILARFI